MFTLEQARRRLLLEKDLNLYFNKLYDTRLKAKWNEFRQVNAFLLAHNELFADIIAVMAFRDGQAVSKILNRRTPFGVEENETRDFTRPVSVETFEMDRHSFSELREPLEYEVLNPTRYYIWKKYLQQMKESYFPRFIAAYFKAVARQVEIHRENFPDVESDYLAINREFMNLLDTELAENPLKN